MLSLLVLSLSWWKGLFYPRCRSLPFLWWNQSLVGLIFKFLRSIWSETLLLGVPATPSDVVLSTDLLLMCSVLSSRSLVKLLNNTDPSTDAWLSWFSSQMSRCWLLVCDCGCPANFQSNSLFVLSISTHLPNENAVKRRFKSLTKFKLFYIHHSPLMHVASHFIVGSSQADQAWLSLGKSILTFSDYHLVFVKLNS